MSTRTCEHCGVQFQTAQSARYCSRAHKDAAANLEAARGKQLYRLAYHWALGRKPPKGLPPSERAEYTARGNKALSDLTWLLDQFINEDREAGVSAPLPGPSNNPVHINHATYHKPPKRDKGLHERHILEKVLGDSPNAKQGSNEHEVPVTSEI